MDKQYGCVYYAHEREGWLKCTAFDSSASTQAFVVKLLASNIDPHDGDISDMLLDLASVISDCAKLDSGEYSKAFAPDVVDHIDWFKAKWMK